MGNPIVVIVRKDLHQTIKGNLDKMVSLGIYGHKVSGKYRILKIRPQRSYDHDKNIGSLGLNTVVSHAAEIIYDAKLNKFLKSRYGDTASSISGMPTDLALIMSPIVEIVNDMKIDYLLENYSRQSVLDSIFLTDSYYERFQDDVDVLEYQVIRYKFGKEILPCYIPEMVKKYPEHLI